MEHIVKSLRPAALVAAAVVLFALGTAFLITADGTLSPSSLGASSDLSQAARWLQFLAAAVALVAICCAGWELVLRSEWIGGIEVAAVALGTLMIVIGLLASAASTGGSPAGAVIAAVGIGTWALLVLSRAARASLAEQASPPTAGKPQADVWLAAAAGLLVLAIGYGFTSASGSRGPGIAAGILQAAGVATLAGSLIVARQRGYLHTRPVPGVLAGLALLGTSFLVGAVVAGLAPATLSALGAGLAIAAAIELAAVVVLGLATWNRVRELYSGAEQVVGGKSA